ncbi:MAG: DegV family protein [Lachnospiraceae bacterium]
MEKIAVLTDSNSGFTKEEAAEHEIHILPMTFFVGGEECIEGVTLSEEEFFERMKQGYTVSTTQPSLASLSELWDGLLNTYDKVIHIPMSKALSGGYSAAAMFSRDYDGRVLVVDSRRISVTQASAAIQAARLVSEGMQAEEIKKRLEDMALEASIYITVDTLEYLKRGGRIRSAEALAGEILNIKPVIQVKGGLLEPYCKVRGRRRAKKEMEDAILRDGKALMEKYGSERLELYVAHADAGQEAEEWAVKVESLFPGKKARLAKLPMSICCHVGPGTIGVGVCVSRS